jgi:hypothetical protein
MEKKAKIIWYINLILWLIIAIRNPTSAASWYAVVATSAIILLLRKNN